MLLKVGRQAFLLGLGAWQIEGTKTKVSFFPFVTAHPRLTGQMSNGAAAPNLFWGR